MVEDAAFTLLLKPRSALFGCLRVRVELLDPFVWLVLSLLEFCILLCPEGTGAECCSVVVFAGWTGGVGFCCCELSVCEFSLCGSVIVLLYLASVGDDG